MKWAGESIRKGLYDVLTALGVSSYDMVAPQEKPRTIYAILGDYSQSSVNTKDTFTGTALVNIEITQPIQGQFGGRKPIDIITNQLLTTLRPTTNSIGLTAPGFKIENIALSSSFGQLVANENGAFKEYVNIIVLEITFNQI